MNIARSNSTLRRARKQPVPKPRKLATSIRFLQYAKTRTSHETQRIRASSRKSPRKLAQNIAWAGESELSSAAAAGGGAEVGTLSCMRRNLATDASAGKSPAG